MNVTDQKTLWMGSLTPRKFLRERSPRGQTGSSTPAPGARHQGFPQHRKAAGFPCGISGVMQAHQSHLSSASQTSRRHSPVTIETWMFLWIFYTIILKKKKKNEAVFAASTAWHSKKLCSYLIAVVIHSPLRSSSPEISTITQHSFAPDPHPVKEGNTEIHHHALQNSRLKKTGGVSQYLPFVLQHWCIMQQAPRAGQWGQGKNGSILQPGAVGWELRMLPCWLFPPGGSNLTAAGLW